MTRPRVDPAICSADEFCDRAKEHGAWMLPFSDEHVRAVTHLHITKTDAATAGQIIAQVVEASVPA